MVTDSLTLQTKRDVIFDVPTPTGYARVLTGFVSFQDLFNFNLHHYLAALNMAQQEVEAGLLRMQEQGEGALLSESDKTRIAEKLKYIERKAQELSLTGVQYRLNRIHGKFRLASSLFVVDIAKELNTLIEAFHDDTQFTYFYAYPQEKVPYVLQYQTKWQSVLNAFPSTAKEIGAGADCYALGYNTACVFHMMRVAEVGLRCIAKERGVKKVRRGNTPVEWGTWGDVFKAIDDEIEKLRQKSAGPKKDAALAFYNSVLGDLHAIQDLYRDKTMHFRESYDDGQAQSAMFRVNSLMSTLACRLNETSTRRIGWGI